MRIFAVVAISVGLTLGLAWLPLAGIWLHIARWAFYVPILLVGTRCGWFAGLSAGITATLLCLAVAASRASEVSWEILMPDFAVVGLLGGFLRTEPRFRKLYSAEDPDPWPALSRVFEREITPDPSPLASIESAAQLLGESDNPAELRQELVGIIVTECKHLSATIAGLLEQRREPMPPCEADIVTIIDAAIRDAEFVFSGCGIVVRKEIAPDVPPIQCNPDQIRNLCVSLIINASQSVIGGTEVLLDAHAGGDGLALDIKGQPPLVYRVANRLLGARRKTSGGSLLAAQDIVRQHGGRISATADLGKGLEFSVWLPLRRNESHAWQSASGGGR
jgi:hypothetical protein